MSALAYHDVEAPPQRAARPEPVGPAPIDFRALRKAIAPFQAPSLKRSVWQLVSTLGAYLAVNAAMYAALRVSVWLALALAPLATGFVIRLFIIQHDCGHGSFFKSRRANALVGLLCSPFTFTPYAFWRRQHNDHHTAFNNLDKRGSGLDIYSTCATVREYAALSPSKRLIYRVSRHPLVTQLILPPFIFLILYRLPFDRPDAWKREGLGVLATNLMIAAALGGLMLVFGVWPVLIVQLPIIALAAIVGTWLFCVQHRFEEAQWAAEDSWHPMDASLHGSSYLKLPPVLQWFTGNIGLHHVHHLDARVPNYRLQACHEAVADLERVTTLTLKEALRAPSYSLWDEDRKQMTRVPSERSLRAAA